jgi:hypothetical protein
MPWAEPASTSPAALRNRGERVPRGAVRSRSEHVRSPRTHDSASHTSSGWYLSASSQRADSRDRSGTAASRPLGAFGDRRSRARRAATVRTNSMADPGKSTEGVAVLASLMTKVSAKGVPTKLRSDARRSGQNRAARPKPRKNRVKVPITCRAKSAVRRARRFLASQRILTTRRRRWFHSRANLARTSARRGRVRLTAHFAPRKRGSRRGVARRPRRSRARPA